MAPEALAGGAGKSGAASEVSLSVRFSFIFSQDERRSLGLPLQRFCIWRSQPRLRRPDFKSSHSTRPGNDLPEVPGEIARIPLRQAGALAEDLRASSPARTYLPGRFWSTVRFARWARRRPAPAACSRLILGALAATFAAIAFERSEARGREQMFEAQLARAESLHGSKRRGPTDDALAALRAAAKIKVTPRSALPPSRLSLRPICASGSAGPPGGRNFAFAFAPDLETSVTEQEPGMLEWRVGQQGAIKARLDARAAGRVTSQAIFSPDGRFLLTRHADKAIRLWSLAEGRTIATLSGNPPTEPETAFDLAWRPDSAEFALPRQGGGLAFYSPNDGAETRQWNNVLAPAWCDFLRMGGLRAVLNKTVVVLAAAAARERARIQLDSASRLINWHPNGKRLASVVLTGASGCLTRLAASSNRSSSAIATHPTFAFFPDGTPPSVTEGRERACGTRGQVIRSSSCRRSAAGGMCDSPATALEPGCRISIPADWSSK